MNLTLKKLFEIAGVDPSLGKARRLVENVEDQQAEFADRIQDGLSMIADPAIRTRFERRFNQVNTIFGQACDDDDDDQIYGALSDLEDMANEIEAYLAARK